MNEDPVWAARNVDTPVSDEYRVKASCLRFIYAVKSKIA